ncbi:hypothetical protein H1R20_g6684, partial [Candolleomyces eurysporus]
MGRNDSYNVERAHHSRSRSQSFVSQEPKRKKKRQNKEESTGRKPPKNMAVAQARKILAKKDLWGYRILPNGFDPETIAGAPPAASVIDFGSWPQGESYAMSMDHALCHKSVVPDDLVANRKPKYISQAMAHMTQPSEYAEFGSESTDSFHAGSGTSSPADFDVPASCSDMPHIPMEQMSLSQMDLADPSMLNVPQFQDDWSSNYAITTSFQNSGPQTPAPFPFANSDSVPLTTMFNCPTTGPYPEGPYPGTNAMAYQDF